LLGKMT